MRMDKQLVLQVEVYKHMYASGCPVLAGQELHKQGMGKKR